MANYIDKEIICEAYVHLEFDDYSNEDKLKKIKNTVKKYFDDRVEFLLGDSIETFIETEEGSLKLKVTAVAGIATLVGSAILKYPDFRNSIKTIHEDSKLLAEATALETIFVTKTPSCDRLHTEARTGVIGKTAKIISALETLSEHSKGIKAPATKADIKVISDLNAKIISLTEEVSKLLEKINNDDDRYCIAKGMFLSFKQFPEVMPAEQDLKKSEIKQTLLNSDDLKIKIQTEFHSYTAAIRSAKEMIKRIGVASKPKNA